MTSKRLYRSRTDRVIFGVMGGLGDYFQVDPVIFRLLYLVITIFTAVVPAVIVYLIAVIIIPAQPVITPSSVVDDPEVA